MFGLVTYLDWVMILVTTLSCLSMIFESPRYQMNKNKELQIVEFGFVFLMGIELGFKILAEGLLFTPKALFKDAFGIFDAFTFSVSLQNLSCTYFPSLMNNLIIVGCINGVVLDAGRNVSKFLCPDTALVALFATSPHFYSGSTNEKSYLRIISRI